MITKAGLLYLPNLQTLDRAFSLPVALARRGRGGGWVGSGIGVNKRLKFYIKNFI